MPPVTPRRILATACAYPLPAVAVLDLVCGDLLEGDLEVVLRLGVHHRRRVLVEGPLPKVVVVRVDLTGALGGDDHARVVRVDSLQQLVQAGLGHSFAPSGDCRPSMVAAACTSSSTARSRSSLTITCSHSDAAASSSRARARRRSISSGASVLLASSRSRSVSSDGGAMNTCLASGSASPTCRAPCTSISSTMSLPASRARSSSERGVPYMFCAYMACSRNSPRASRRSNSSVVRKW